jgi:putative membrane protein
MLNLLLGWILNAAALLLVAYLYPGVKIDDFVTALIAALVLGLVNTIVRPILVILTLPATILTLGLFLFVINAFCFWFVAEAVRGFRVDGAVAALVGSLLYSVITLVVGWVLLPRKR